MIGGIIICIAAVTYGLMAERLSKTPITAPIVFISLGAILATSGTLSTTEINHFLHPLAEFALVVVLFLDAAKTNFAALERRHIWPQRMLLIGLPLAIIFGTLAFYAILPAWPLAMVALAAAVLSPTDAALGQAVVSNTAVPERDRRALTVESGLNDGMALPIILMLTSLVAIEVTSEGAGHWLIFGLKQITLGPLVGAIIGTSAGIALLKAKANNTTTEAYEGAATLAIAGGAYLIANYVGGNGFIATFVAGLCFGHKVQGQCPFVYEFAEGEGQLLTWTAFLFIGAGLVPEAISHLTWPMFLAIMVSLFIVRPLAIWISLIGTDAPPVTRLFFGWFGPRGLATALFALLVLHELPEDAGHGLLMLAANAVWISALLHGLSSAPAARWYGKISRPQDG